MKWNLFQHYFPIDLIPRAFLQALPIRSAIADAHVALARYKNRKACFLSLKQAWLGESRLFYFAVLVETRKVKEPTPELLCLQNQFFKCAIRGSNPGHPD